MVKGEYYKHFKGENIYEILETGVIYSGDASDKPIENLVIYKNVFQGKIFARELEDLIEELPIERQKIYGQKHRMEKLSEEEVEKLKNKLELIKK